MDRDGKNSRVVTGNFDNSFGAPRWAADGKSLIADYVDHGISKVARVGLDGKVETVVGCSIDVQRVLKWA